MCLNSNLDKCVTAILPLTNLQLPFWTFVKVRIHGMLQILYQKVLVEFYRSDRTGMIVLQHWTPAVIISYLGSKAWIIHNAIISCRVVSSISAFLFNSCSLKFLWIQLNLKTLFVGCPFCKHVLFNDCFKGTKVFRYLYGSCHSSVDSFAPTILRSWVWIPCAPSTIL